MTHLATAQLVFWDFDGVIKDSVEVKTEAYVALFQAHGVEVAERVRAHHLANGGMSRYDKLPLYLTWAGKRADPETLAQLDARFSELALEGVIASPWVPGVEAWLRGNPRHQTHVLVSATPREELLQIVGRLNLTRCFARIYGAPTPKREALAETLRALDVPPEACLMVGDALADLDAAVANQVPFLLRRHPLNTQVFQGHEGPAVEDFTRL